MSDDYEILMLGIPHLGELDAAVAEAIRRYPRQPAGIRLQLMEIGCGSGRATATIMAARDDLQLVAVDNEPRMIALACRGLQPAIDRKALSVVEADALAYLRSSGDACFDIVASALVLHNFLAPYRAEVLEEILRVLRPGGLLVNADKYVHDDPLEFHKALQEHIALFFDGIGPSGRIDLLKQVVLHELVDFGPERIMRRGEALRLMTELGYEGCSFVYRRNLDAVLLARKPPQESA